MLFFSGALLFRNSIFPGPYDPEPYYVSAALFFCNSTFQELCYTGDQCFQSSIIPETNVSRALLYRKTNVSRALLYRSPMFPELYYTGDQCFQSSIIPEPYVSGALFLVEFKCSIPGSLWFQSSLIRKYFFCSFRSSTLPGLHISRAL